MKLYFFCRHYIWHECLYVKMKIKFFYSHRYFFPNLWIMYMIKNCLPFVYSKMWYKNPFSYSNLFSVFVHFQYIKLKWSINLFTLTGIRVFQSNLIFILTLNTSYLKYNFTYPKFKQNLVVNGLKMELICKRLTA